MGMKGAWVGAEVPEINQKGKKLGCQNKLTMKHMKFYEMLIDLRFSQFMRPESCVMRPSEKTES